MFVFYPQMFTDFLTTSRGRGTFSIAAVSRDSEGTESYRRFFVFFGISVVISKKIKRCLTEKGL